MTGGMITTEHAADGRKTHFKTKMESSCVFRLYFLP
jgi:hypothetical protein